MNTPAQTNGCETSATTRLATATARMDWERLPSDVRRIAGHCLLDWLGVTIRAANEPLVKLLADNALDEGGRGVSSIVGHAAKVTVRQAALVNGSASHALDYDDVNINMLGHPTVAVMPAVLALAQAKSIPGREFLAGFVAGYETAATLGDMVRPGHYGRGFHVTGTVGAIAAAAGCARLLCLDPERTATAMGIAATQASGLKAMFGTMCKPLHAGKANENGVLAAQLSALGFESRTNAIEADHGFAATQSDTFTPDRTLPQGGYHIRNNLFKYHACCYQTHAAIDAVRSLVDAHGLSADDIVGIDLLHDSGADSVCNIPEPTTGLEAKFSLRMVAAMGVAGVDTADPDSFSNDMISRPDLVALRDRVTVRFIESWPVTRSETSITLKDGRTLKAEKDSGIPDDDIDRQGERLAAKFMTLASPELGTARAERLAEIAFGIEHLDSVDEIATHLATHKGREK